MSQRVRDLPWPERAAVLKQRLRMSPVAEDRVFGTAGNLSNDSMMHYVRRAPGRFKKFQATIHGPNTVGLKAAVAASAVFGSAIYPYGSSGSVQAFTNLTWGSSDEDDYTNPGGGQTYGAITNASASNTLNYPATDGWKEGSASTDWVDLDSIDATDSQVERWLTFLRWYAPFNNSGSPSTWNGVNVPNGNRCPGYRSYNLQGDFGNQLDLIEPETRVTYIAGGDQVTNTSGINTAGIAGFSGGILYPFAVGACVTLRFLLSDLLGLGLLIPGDSLVQGYNTNFGAGLDGWGRKLRRKLINLGIPAWLVNAAWTTELSSNFHVTAERAVRRGNGTHLICPVYSQNDYQLGDAGWSAAKSRVMQLLQLSQRRNKQFIAVEPVVNSQWMPRVAAFVDALEKGGVPVIRIPKVICEGDRMTVKKQFQGPLDFHWGDPAHEAISDEALSVVLGVV